jgi:hypothetical protein
MKKMTSVVILLLLIILALLIFIFLRLKDCDHTPKITGSGAASTAGFPKDSAVRWADWNVLFKPTSTDRERTLTMARLRDSIGQYLTGLNNINKRSDSVFVNIVFCPCDSFLYNLTADISIGAVGTLATIPPKIPPPGSQGDLVLNILLNNPFKDIAGQPNLPDTAIYNPANYTANPSKILAIMDTGLDSTLFANGFRGLLWSDPGGPTIRNFLQYINGLDISYYYDEGQNKHGSAVTSTALEAIRKANAPNNKLPEIMVLRVLDSSGTGSTFSVSCALSYARKKNATLINASLGYYGQGEQDSILKHYVTLCNEETPNRIPIIAAAGNLRGSHSQGFYDSLVNIAGPNPNLLIDTNLFFPGCYSVDLSNVICVTGLHSVDSPCYYQNYSPQYVSIGVVTNPSSPFCCISGVHFAGMPEKGYDGTSFATPVVSGQVMAKLLKSDMRAIDAVNQIGTKPVGTGSGPVTKKVITYRSIP